MTGSLGLLVPALVSSMVPAVSSHARRRRRIEAPKFRNFPVIVRRFPDVHDDLGWSELVAGDGGNQFQVVAFQKSGGINGGKNGSKPRLSELDRRRSGQFPETMTAEMRRSSSKLQIGTNVAQNGGRKWKLRSGHGRGSGSGSRVKNFTLLSHSGSFSKWSNPFSSFPVIPCCFFFFFFLKNLIQIKLHSDPWRNKIRPSTRIIELNLSQLNYRDEIKN